MIEQLQQFIAEQPHSYLFVTLSGAHLYGFPSEDSDFDLRGVHILPLEQVIGLNSPKDTIESNQERYGMKLDIVTYDAKKFFQLLLQNNGNALENLYSPLVIYTTPEHETLKEIAQGNITKYDSNHYLGFARSKWQRFAKEEPYLVKDLLYVFRVLLTGIHLMQTGEIQSNLPQLNEVFQLQFIDELIDKKKNEGELSFLDIVDLNYLTHEYARLSNHLEEARNKTHLPDKATNRQELHDFLLHLRLRNAQSLL